MMRRLQHGRLQQRQPRLVRGRGDKGLTHRKQLRLKRGLVAIAAAIVACLYISVVAFFSVTSTSSSSPLKESLSNSKSQSRATNKRTNAKDPSPQLIGWQGATWTTTAVLKNGTVLSQHHKEHSLSESSNPLFQFFRSAACQDTDTSFFHLIPGHQANVTICVNGTLPHFRHTLPNFVPNTNDSEIFLMQPENTKSVRKEWMDPSWETCFVFKEQGAHERSSPIKVTARIVGVQSLWFQHFHDNALSFLFQVKQGLDAIQHSASRKPDCPALDIRILYEKPARGSELLHQEWQMLGFDPQQLYPTSQFQKVMGGDISVVRKRYPRDADQVRLHPIHAQWFQSNLDLPKPSTSQKQKKIIWLSRQGAQSTGIFARQCSNEDDVIHYLKQHAPRSNFIEYNPSRSKPKSVQDLVSGFGDACAIVGIHGGGLYNQFFASPDTAIIELFPVKASGLIHGQTNVRSTPQIAHRSIWHNSNALQQPFWRIHFESVNAREFDIPKGTMGVVVRALELSKCI